MRASALPLFELADAAKAAGCTVERLAAWVSRGNITPAQPATGSGGRHKFSRDDIIVIALAFRLWRAGLDPSDAFGIAAAWLEDTRHRPAGELYPTGTTLLVAREDLEGRIVNADHVVPVGAMATMAVNCNEVVAAVEPNLVERRFVPFKVVSTSLSRDERDEAVATFLAKAGAA